MSAIIVIFVIAALVWSAVGLRYGGLPAGCLAVLLLGSCFGAPFFSYEAGPLPVTADRLMLVAVAVTYVALRHSSATDRKPLQTADWVLAGLLAVLTLSTFAHDWQIEQMMPAARLVFYFICPATLYWVARQSRLTEWHLQVTAFALSAFAVYLAATAIAEAGEMWWLVWPNYIESPVHSEFLGRGRGPFLNPIGCGFYLLAGLVFLLVQPSPTARPARGARWALAAFLVAGIYCTLTRSVWLAAAMVLMIQLARWMPRRARLPSALLLVVVTSGFLATGWDRLSAFKRDENVSVHEMAQSARLRPILAAVAWNIFQDRPLLGVGFGQYKQHDKNYLRNSNSELPLERARPYDQHSTFLALLTETGLLGASCFVLLLGCWTGDAMRLIRRGVGKVQTFGWAWLMILLCYAINAVFHDVSVIPMLHMLLFMLAGLVRGLACRQARVAPAPSVPRAAPNVARQPVYS